MFQSFAVFSRTGDVLLSPKLFRFLIHIITALDQTMRLCIAIIAACLSTEMVIFSCKVFFVIIFLLFQQKLKLLPGDFPHEKKLTLYENRSGIVC